MILDIFICRVQNTKTSLNNGGLLYLVINKKLRDRWLQKLINLAVWMLGLWCVLAFFSFLRDSLCIKSPCKKFKGIRIGVISLGVVLFYQIRKYFWNLQQILFISHGVEIDHMLIPKSINHRSRRMGL